MNIRTFLLIFISLFVCFRLHADIIMPLEYDINYINDIEIDGDYIWCATNGGVVVWNMKDESYNVFGLNDELPTPFIKSVTIDSLGVKWFTHLGVKWFTPGELTSFDGYSWKLFNYKNSNLLKDSVLCINVDHNNIKWLGIYGGPIMSFDNVEWKIYDKGYFYHDISVIAIDRNNVKWFGLDFGYVGSFNGETWTEYPRDEFNNSFSKLKAIAVDNNNDKWLSSFLEGVWILRNNSWNKLEQSKDIVHCITIDRQNRKWFGTFEGLQIYNDESYINYGIEDGLVDTQVLDIAIDYNDNVWIVTPKGLQKFDGKSFTTYLAEPVNVDSGNHDRSFPILSNYPNPFNSSTTIWFSIDFSCYTILNIYNLRGQKVRHIISDRLNAGVFSFVWDGKNEHGLDVSSGIYLLSFQANGFKKVNKMLLIK